MSGARPGIFSMPNSGTLRQYGIKAGEYAIVATAAVSSQTVWQILQGVFGQHVCTEQVTQAISTLANTTYIYSGRIALEKTVESHIPIVLSSVVVGLAVYATTAAVYNKYSPLNKPAADMQPRKLS